MENIRIQTTQNISIDYQMASLADRMAALFLDYLIFGAYSIVLLLINDHVIEFSTTGWILFSSVPVSLYHLVCEVLMNGQSFGKKALKIKVVMMDGTEAKLGNYVIRWMFRLIENPMFFGGAIAVIAIIINQKAQRLGDVAAKTTVIKLRKKMQLKETVFEDVPDDYRVSFYEVRLLNDEDINTIKEVLNYAKGKEESVLVTNMMITTKQNVMKKMGVESDWPSPRFLTTVLKDYNYINRFD